MTTLDSLRQDHATLVKILEARRAVSVETLPVGMRIWWSIYLQILKDGVSTLTSLIRFMITRA